MDHSAIQKLNARIATLESTTKQLRRSRDDAHAHIQEIHRSRAFKLVRFLQRLAAIIRPTKVMQAPTVTDRSTTAVSVAGDAEPSLSLNDSLNRSRERHDALVSAVANIPTSKGAAIAPKHGLNVAILTDVYMHNYYKDCFRQTYVLTPDNYEDILLFEDVDLFLYVTCWRGVYGNEWRGHASDPARRAAVGHILDICAARQVPTLFHSIEDPSNYEHFLPLAKRFGYVVTADVDCVDKYKKDIGHNNVAYAEYGVNPLFNNPIGSLSARNADVFFAGSFPKRYPQRCADMELIFDSVVDSDVELTIADRNYDINQRTLKGGEDGDYAFPPRYGDMVIEALPHEILQAVHKYFKVNLNFNSITRSPTKGAMRVYELQAQGSLIISNYALSTSMLFPDIDTIAYPKNIWNIIDPPHVLQSEEKRERMVRNILSNRTAYDNVAKIMEHFPELKSDSKQKHMTIAMVVAMGAAFDQQEVGGGQFRIARVPAEIANPEMLAKFDFIAFLDEGHSYERHYLQDAVNAFKFVDVPFVTVKAQLDENSVIGPVHEFVRGYDDRGATVFNTRLIDIADVLGKLSDDTLDGYAIAPFSLDYSKTLAARSAAKVLPVPTLSVIVPVFNNGRYLEQRCFASLLTNERFFEFEILLIDDGSTDAATVETIERLDAQYANVRVFRFGGAPSGSASRPRNKGIELARAPDITFLDPDNAISPGGYDALLDHRKRQPDVSAILGYQVKLAEKVSVVGKLYPNSPHIVKNPRTDLIESGRFPVISTQCALLKRRHLQDHGIDYVTGAVGQDTMFGYEVLALAENGVVFVHDAYLEYFSERTGSVTNKLGPDFFAKSLILEKEQHRRFGAHGVWGAYSKKRAKSFVEGWYIVKFNELDESTRAQCRPLLNEIIEINGLVGQVTVERETE